MYTIKALVLLSFFFILTLSCTETQTPASKIQEETTNTAEIAPIEEEIPLTIFQNSFLNISPGSQIAEHEAIIKKGVLETAEVDSDVYYIYDEKNGELGYFFVDYHDNELVGNICITSALAKTEDNIGVGDSFGDLVTNYKELEVHGSEIESRTVANQGNLAFRIDEPHSTHDLEITAISKEAKILEITIER
jgi:hypothetical protein